ncbi:MAG: phenylalanine--tRNA ligase subunit beta [Bacilli bacterium]|nr:phenylalanine--tRNA ligase subunit beta [Bacilli bacterium]
MKVSVNWLNDYIDINQVEPSEIANKMILIGNEVEKIEELSTSNNLVVGHVTNKIKHPDADKLSICTVDLGEDEPSQIVCGARNVDIDQKVIVAKVGAILPGNFKIKAATIRGIESNGMICSLEELGIESKYIPDSSKDGIHVLPNDAPVGVDALKYMGLDDTVITYELTADRNDLLSMIGMAYETRAIVGNEVRIPETGFKEIEKDINKYLSLKVDTDNCPKYFAKIVEAIKIGESPEFIKTRLMVAGIRSINNVIDISNYVMLEYGQPLHFFDYDKLGTNIVVRMANHNEKFITLDNIERHLSSDDIVITNGKEPVALAGVMGGHNTEVDNNTKTIVIESAIFNLKNIRNTAKRTLQSEASIRFERGLDPNKTIEALNRVCHLLEKYASGKVLNGILSHDNLPILQKEILLRKERVNNVLGVELNDKDITTVFDKLSFSYKQDKSNFFVTIPSRRMDINIEEDLIEEIGRIYGYNNIIGVLPESRIKPGRYDQKYLKIKQIKEKMKSFGLYEVMTYSLINNDNVNKFTNDSFTCIGLNNPMSEEKNVLRYSLLDSLLKVEEYNLARNIKNINIFEVASSYYQENNAYLEETKLAAIMCGEYLMNVYNNQLVSVDFYLIKGLLEELFNYLGLANRYKFNKPETNINELHPGISAEIFVDNELVGYVGCINPIISDIPFYMFEISLDKVLSKSAIIIRYKETPKYPSISRDVAFILNKDILAKSVIEILKKVGGKLLTNIQVFDVYTDDKIGSDKKSIAFNLTFRDNNKTLTEEEVTPIIEKIITTIETSYNALMRRN